MLNYYIWKFYLLFEFLYLIFLIFYPIPQNSSHLFLSPPDHSILYMINIKISSIVKKFEYLYTCLMTLFCINMSIFDIITF